jgi:hypothetical protein
MGSDGHIVRIAGLKIHITHEENIGRSRHTYEDNIKMNLKETEQKCKLYSRVSEYNHIHTEFDYDSAHRG